MNAYNANVGICKTNTKLVHIRRKKYSHVVLRDLLKTWVLNRYLDYAHRALPDMTDF